MVSIEQEEPITTEIKAYAYFFHGKTTKLISVNVETETGRAFEEPITTSYLINPGQTTRPVTVYTAFNPADWLYQDEVLIIENSGKDLTDFQVLLELTADNFDFTKAQDNGEDIRFTDTGLKLLLPYWIESWDKVNKKARVWIRIPSIPANGTVIIWFFYGNPSAESESDSDAVFEFFDDFEDNDISDWSTNMWGNNSGDIIADEYRMRLRVYRCYNVEAYQDIGAYANTTLAFRFDWETKADNWGESAAWSVLENETEVDKTVISGENISVGRGTTRTGSVEAIATINDGTVTLLYRIYQSSYCNYHDHGNTYLWIDNIRVRKYTDPEPSCTIKAYGETTKPVGLNVHVKPAECKTVKTLIAQHSFSVKDITALIQQYGTAIKSIIADIVYYSWRTKPVQTKIWWDSGKTVRTVQARVGKPATIKPVTVKCGFPKTARSVRLKTPIGYKEIWKTVQLTVEKYSEIVTRIVVADTRHTTYGFVTKPVGLNIGKYPYNAKTITAKVEQYGKSIKTVSCDIYVAKGQSVKPVGCKVNKSRQIINVGLSIHEYTGESIRSVGLSVQPHGETVKPVGLSVWSDLSETVKSVGLSAVIPGEAHKPVKLSVWSDLSETVKPVGLFVVSYPETYKAVRANVSPTHRWIPVSANIVRSGVNYRAVKANIINEVWAFDWQSINARIEKYAAHTKNIRARRIVRASIKYYEGYHIRPVSVNVNVPTANTRAVKLKIHMFKVYGTIIDENGKPVKDATVFLYKRGSGEFITAKTTRTNYEGYYEIPEVPYGKYYVLAIKLAHDLVFSPIVVNGKHIDIEKNMPCYTVSRDVCVEEILSPIGDVYRFQVIYDETFPDGTRITDILLIWGDLYGNLPAYYRDTDGIFMVESPESARLTVVHDFWETGGRREEGKDDHFLKPVPHQLPPNECYCNNCRCTIKKETEETPCSELRCPYCGNYSLSDTYYTYEPTTEHPSNVTWFAWKASLYHPNFIGFIVRCVSRADTYTIFSINIGGQYLIPTSSPYSLIPFNQRLSSQWGGGDAGRGTGGRSFYPNGRGFQASLSPPPPGPPGGILPPTPCIEGTHEVFEYCPDGVTEKRWRDCINGKWVYGSLECSTTWRSTIRPVRTNVFIPPDMRLVRTNVLLQAIGWTIRPVRTNVFLPEWKWMRLVRTNVFSPLSSNFRRVRCNIELTGICRPTAYLPPVYGPYVGIHPTVMGYILARPQWSQNVKTVTVSVGFPESTTRQITTNVGLPATSKTVRCTVNYYVTAITRAIRTNIAEPVVASNTKRVSCKLPLFERGYSSRTIRMNILKVSKYPVPVSGELLVIDAETGYLLYVCEVGNDGFYAFSVPPNRCYYLIINKYGYRSHMGKICIGNITVVDRNTKEYGGDIFDCEMNCYYYIRGFAFPPLEPSLMNKIYGYVYDAHTLKPIRFALISVDGGLFAAVTDENGYYEVFVTVGTHKVRCSAGRRYKPVEATVVMKSDVRQDFYLTLIPRRITFTGGLIHKPIYI